METFVIRIFEIGFTPLNLTELSKRDPSAVNKTVHFPLCPVIR